MVCWLLIVAGAVRLIEADGAQGIIVDIESDNGWYALRIDYKQSVS